MCSIWMLRLNRLHLFYYLRPYYTGLIGGQDFALLEVLYHLHSVIIGQNPLFKVRLDLPVELVTGDSNLSMGE